MNRNNNWQKLLGLTLALIALVLVQGPPSLAQTKEPQAPSPEVQQLRERLQLLEQTVKDLKDQLTSIESRKDAAPAPAIVQATYSPSSALTRDSAAATETSPRPPQDANGESTLRFYGFAMSRCGLSVQTERSGLV